MKKGVSSFVRKKQNIGVRFEIKTFLLWSTMSLLIFKSWSSHMPARDWDHASAHSYVGQALFRGWYEADWMAGANGSTYLWPLVDILMYLPRLFKAPHLGIFFLSLIVVYGTIRVLLKISKLLFSFPNLSKVQVHVSVAISLLSPYWLGEIGTTLQSWITLPMVLSSLYFLLLFQKDTSNKKNLFLSGALLGFSFALKFTNIIYVLSSLFILFFSALIKSDKNTKWFKKIWTFSLGLITGVLPIIPWWTYSFASTGNPVFPYFNSIFKSTYYPLVNFKDTRWEWGGLNSVLNIPTGWFMGTPVAELKSTDIRVSIIFFLYIFLSLMLISKHLFNRMLSSSVESKYLTLKVNDYSMLNIQILFHFWIISATAFWIYLFGYVRYWIAIEVLLGIAIVHLISLLISFERLRNMVIASILITVAACINPPNWTKASSVSGIGSFQEPWESALTTEVAKISGVLLIEGSPTSFLRETSPKVTNMVNLDFPNTPERFKLIAREQIRADKLHLVTTRVESGLSGISAEISSWLRIDNNLDVKCSPLEGPIYVSYHLCTLRLS